MSVHRIRNRNRKPQTEPVDGHQLEVDDHAEELAALWRVMPDAVARDSAGMISGDRHESGGSKGSPTTVNVGVVDAAARIESGLYARAAEAVRLLNEDRDRARSALTIIGALPDWHRSLAARGQPLAGYLRKDLAGWVNDARDAIGTKRRDEPLGKLCPDHRDTKPTQLRMVGRVARIAQSLLAGPLTSPRFAIGPTCPRGVHVRCAHESCARIRDRRIFDERGRPTDWYWPHGADEPVWDGGNAFTWETSSTIRCPRCKTTWSTTAERRILARRLAELGDAPLAAVALI